MEYILNKIKFEFSLIFNNNKFYCDINDYLDKKVNLILKLSF